MDALQLPPRSRTPYPLARPALIALALVVSSAAVAGCAGGGSEQRPAVPSALLAAPATRPAPAPAAPAVAYRVIDLGRSVEGRPLSLHVFGSAPWPTLVVGGIHGNEPTSADLARRLIEHLRGHPEALGHRCVAILPEANPDGLVRKLRANKNLIDLNRNFPARNWARSRRGAYFGGESPASEPETRAVVKAFEAVSPARVVAIHSMAQPCNNYDGPAGALAESMARHNGYPVKDSIGYATPGSLGTWAGVDRRIPIVTLELPRALAGEGAWEANRAALLAVVRAGEVETAGR